MAENKLAKAFFLDNSTTPEDKTRYIAAMRAICFDIRATCTAAAFIATDGHSGVAFYEFVQKTGKRPTPRDPFRKAGFAAELAVEVSDAALRLSEVATVILKRLDEMEKE
jgi:hypothetical protein